MKSIMSLIAILFVSSSLFAQVPRVPNVLEQWGGRGIEVLVLEGHQARVTFDCGSGYVEEGRWPLNQSRINAVGTVTKHTGVRPPPGYVPRSEKATFAANIDNQKGKMTLTVKVGKTRATVYKLIKDQPADLKRCL